MAQAIGSKRWLSVGLLLAAGVASTAGAAQRLPLMPAVMGEAAAPSSATAAFDQALDLIHAYTGAGDEHERAMRMADELLRSAPRSGYAQTLRAEWLSTWQIDQQGEPAALRDPIMALCDEALTLNPKLAQAHVAKGRVLVRASMYREAAVSIDRALKLAPGLAGALFLRADTYRKTGVLNEADVWYQKFIAAAATNTRKSNGYGWMADMYRSAAESDPGNRESYLAKAKSAYESMMQLNPGGAWRHVNYAIFLNDHVADFERAEAYALRALTLSDMPMARFQWAAARYQRLLVGAVDTAEALSRDAETIGQETGISLTDAVTFPAFSDVVRQRLMVLQKRLPQGFI
jgi:tetratricopeptide (TPR) repeat protein